MDERRRFIDEWARRKIPIARLAQLFGVSRKTAHKWIGRFRDAGDPGLADRSRAPKRTPHATSDEVVAAIVDARSAHPTWGPRKLRAWLQQRGTRLELPAPSTIGEILKSFDLVTPRKTRRRGPARTAPFAAADVPNATWCADFKGEFTVGDGKRCYPLTISDAFSRYLLCCHGLRGTAGAGARPIIERTFREFGLPEVIRTDGGAPFGSRGPCGLSRLSVWWIRLGITHEIIEPGKPQQNGRHERMHLTLKQDTALPPRSSFSRQQEAFDGFRREYNDERPHEALDDRPPASVYFRSHRPYPPKIPELAYPTNVAIRRVGYNGTIKWRNERTFISEALAREFIGLREIIDGIWSVVFGPLEIGLLGPDGHFIAGPPTGGLARGRAASAPP